MADKPNTELQKKGEQEFGALVVKGVTGVVKRNPVKFSIWILGLLLAAFGTGFAVDDTRREQYEITLQHAEEVSGTELVRAYGHYQRAEQKHYNLKGWFWQCDNRCQKALDEANMAKAELTRVQKKRDTIVREARREVGIWSKYGVADVRRTFWDAWQSGKDFAKRYTMMDAMFMMFSSRKEESAVEMILKLAVQYIVNLTMGLCGAFFMFVCSLYTLINDYGAPLLSGIAFFLLVVAAGMATIGTYLGAIFGTAVGGGYYLVKKAQEQARLEGEHGRQYHRPVQNGPRPGFGQRPGVPSSYGPGGYGRAHQD